jgi:hypothetical protein
MLALERDEHILSEPTLFILRIDRKQRVSIEQSSQLFFLRVQTDYKFPNLFSTRAARYKWHQQNSITQQCYYTYLYQAGA